MSMQCFEIQGSIQVMGSLTWYGVQEGSLEALFCALSAARHVQNSRACLCQLPVTMPYGSILPFGKNSGLGALLSISVKEEAGT